VVSTFSNGALEKMITHMNRHIPSTRKRLSELSKEKDPTYIGKNGTTYNVSHKELELLSSHLDEFEQTGLRIPIIIMTDTSYPGGAWKVMGKLEVKVVSRLIGREPESSDMVRLFYPHLHELLRMLPTTTTILYMP